MDKAKPQVPQAASADRKVGRQTALASIGAVVSLIAASSCCLPLLPFVAAAGLAGSSAYIAALRPYLLVAAVLLIGYGLYQGYRAKQCNRTPSRVSTILLWCSAVVVAISLFFPQVVANLLAGG